MEFIESRRNEADKAAWLEKRKHYVTGTDAGKLIGVSPWGGMFSVWCDKTGRAEPLAETPAMRAGKAMESTILKMYAEETNCRLEHMDGYDLVTCDKYPRLGASLDGWNHDAGIPVDAKNIRWKDEKWGDAYTDRFPEYYKAQLQVQMMVTGARFAHLAVMFSGQDFFVYSMEYDEDMAQRILDASDNFWPYVENDQMPEADGSDQADAFIRNEYAKGKDDLEKEATDEVKECIMELVNAKAAKKAAEERESEMSNRIKVFMGDATVIPGYATWKNAKDSVKVDWESVAREAMASMAQKEKTELIDRYTTLKPGARTLRITAKGF
ncbi:MAG: YqaJ viral recombinase family protein [Fibrobacter sp.]|nr:YqaJ viral recombinase family protein [Fibrobacter sp.]MBR6449684.1 YqaJ viral recombinase family protein [Fibrobacter sp.]